ncbi:MAG: ASPIC/UnbV domain-containing protein, partial [Planctomycetaceae bacterium]|nr:ASPIC/UnbV domain-containing protein [Planctomycetaceae bacterium]
YFRSSHAGRGVACGDLDDDGGLDLVVVHQNAPPTLLRNRRPLKNFVRLKLVGTRATPSAFGAHITLMSPQKVLTRYIRGGGGYFSQSDLRVLFPVNPEEPILVRVTWPTGDAEVFGNLSPGNTHVLVQGEGDASEPH